MPYGCVADFVVGSLTCSMTTWFPWSSPTLSLATQGWVEEDPGNEVGSLRGLLQVLQFSKFQFVQEWQAKNHYVVVLPLNHYDICYLVWDTEEGLSCLLCFPYTDKIKLLRSALLKIAKCANEGKNTKQKCRSFLRFKNSLFLNEAKCNTFCYFFFTICKVYYNVSCSTVVDSWNCEIACISNKRPLLET